MTRNEEPHETVEASVHSAQGEQVDVIDPTAPQNGKLLRHQIISQEFSGPLPSAEQLQKYEDTVNGAANRIICIAEKEQIHRHMMDKRAIDLEEKKLALAERQTTIVSSSDKLGQWLGFAVSICCIVGSVFLGMNGHYWTSAVLGAIPCAAVINAFRNKQDK